MEKLCVDLMGTYYIGIKLYKDDLNLKVVTTIDTVIGWSKITNYADKRAISITNLVEPMWLSSYSRPIEVAYDQRSEFIGRKFRKYLIETEYGITAKPITLDGVKTKMSTTISFSGMYLKLFIYFRNRTNSQ